MTKSNFEKVAASWIVSWEFSVIYLRTAIPQSGCSRDFFLCAKDFSVLSTVQHRRYLELSICHICLTGNCAAYSCFLKTERFDFTRGFITNVAWVILDYKKL